MVGHRSDATVLFEIIQIGAQECLTVACVQNRSASVVEFWLSLRYHCQDLALRLLSRPRSGNLSTPQTRSSPATDASFSTAGQLPVNSSDII